MVRLNKTVRVTNWLGYSYFTRPINMRIMSELLLISFVTHLFFKATNITANNLATLLKCSTNGQSEYPVEGWKLLFQKASAVLDEALERFSTMVNLLSLLHICGVSLCNDSLKMNLMLFFLAGQQRELSIPVTCSWSCWGDKNRQLWPGTIAEPDLYWQLVPDKDWPIVSLSIQQLPLLPQLKEL